MQPLDSSETYLGPDWPLNSVRSFLMHAHRKTKLHTKQSTQIKRPNSGVKTQSKFRAGFREATSCVALSAVVRTPNIHFTKLEGRRKPIITSSISVTLTLEHAHEAGYLWITVSNSLSKFNTHAHAHSNWKRLQNQDENAPILRTIETWCREREPGSVEAPEVDKWRHVPDLYANSISKRKNSCISELNWLKPETLTNAIILT